MPRDLWLHVLLGCALRFYLIATKYATTISNRVEIATPLNSFKRVQEGIYLYKQGIDPYGGDMVHEIPLILLAFMNIFSISPSIIPIFYVFLDMVTAFLLFGLSRDFVFQKLLKESKEKASYAADTTDLQTQKTDLALIPRWVLYVHLYNPLSVLNCVGLTSTVLSNFLLSLTLLGLVRRKIVICMLPLALETMRSLYPVVLIAPTILMFSQHSVRKALLIIVLFCTMCGTVTWANCLIMNGWSFLDGTLGFIFFYRDLQPNIGLFWYFFTEMFDHFRIMFLITFQMNAIVLYLLPLSFKLRKEPMLLATVLIALTAIFRSYPCLGDVSFYLTLLPLWRSCWRFMAHYFVVFSFFVVTLSIMPALWYLWIYSGSANANFYFGATLAFCTGQIFLVIDLLFAYVRREFSLYNGQKIYINGKEAKLLFE